MLVYSYYSNQPLLVHGYDILGSGLWGILEKAISNTCVEVGGHLYVNNHHDILCVAAHLEVWDKI